MKQLSHESLTVYRRAIEFVAWAAEFASRANVTGVVLDQFKRAFVSIPLNIAEGAGKHTPKDQARFYDIARGSALECGACLDVIVAMKLCDPTEIELGKKLLCEVVAMLFGLTRSITGDQTREQPTFYSPPET